MVAAVLVEPVAVILEEDPAEAVQAAQRRAQVVRDGIGEGFQLGHGGLQVGGARLDTPLQRGVEFADLAFAQVALGDIPDDAAESQGPARIVADTPGGGGWGDPFARPPQLVLRDVRDGVLTAAAAERDYGVVINSDGMRIDFPATQARRKARPAPAIAASGNHSDNGTVAEKS